jgi:hypothetical protein
VQSGIRTNIAAIKRNSRRIQQKAAVDIALSGLFSMTPEPMSGSGVDLGLTPRENVVV